MLTPNDLEWYAARLSIAVYDTIRETPEMSVLGLKDALKDIPGIDSLTVGYSHNGNQLITVGGKTLEVGPMASNEEIRLALQNPFIRTENTKIMSITGLQSGAFQAKLAEMRQKIANSQAAGLAKIDAAVTDGAAQLDAAAEGAAAKANKEISDALQEFGLTTNGGPA
jgi:hypothetical protein